MSYIGVSPSTAAFPFDQFSGNGTTTAFTMSYAPASTTSMVVCISGVVQNPNTYSITGLTLTFSGAPPTGTNNIAVLYLGIPATSVTTPGNTAYLTTTSFTATAGQTTFTPSAAYQVGYINVIRNGSQLAPADFTATNGTTVVLNNACVAGDTVVTQGYTLASLVNALPSTGGTVTGATTFNSTVNINGANVSSYTGFKNRIINGEMDIDQRNNGASVATINGGVYTVDRYQAAATQAAKYTVQRNAGSVAPPIGFSNYVGITSTSAYSVLSTDSFYFQQSIEGYNWSDMDYGTASAATSTLSFWARSSLTGTFGGVVKGYDGVSVVRSYPFTYTIPTANTWTFITVTIPGDTTASLAWSSTQSKTNGYGFILLFSLGGGATFSGAAGSWSTNNWFSATGSTSVVGTSGATLYLTGIQIERGSNATSFEFRDYGRELIMCQRYFCRLGSGAWGFIYSATNADAGVQFPVTMRASPTVSHLANYSLVSIALASYTVTNTVINPSASNSVNGMFLRLTSSGMSASTQACIASESNVGFSAEL